MSPQRSPIEHPAGTLGENNKHVLDSMATAYAAALKLAEKGHDVLCIEAAWAKPIIHIQTSPLCQQFNRGVKVTRIDRHDPKRRRMNVKVAVFEGCQIQWRDVQ